MGGAEKEAGGQSSPNRKGCVETLVERYLRCRNRPKKNCYNASLSWNTGGSREKGELDFKVGEKGGVSVYGLGRFPVTLYYEQWNRLLDAAEPLRAFLEENKTRLKLKTRE